MSQGSKEKETALGRVYALGSDVCSPWPLVFHDVTLVLHIHRAAQENEISMFFLSTERASLGGTLVPSFIASLLVLGQGGEKDGGNREDFQKKQGRDVRWSATGSHMLSAERGSPLGVLKKAVSASPWADSCWAPEACLM